MKSMIFLLPYTSISIYLTLLLYQFCSLFMWILCKNYESHRKQMTMNFYDVHTYTHIFSAHACKAYMDPHIEYIYAWIFYCIEISFWNLTLFFFFSLSLFVCWVNVCPLLWSSICLIYTNNCPALTNMTQV